MDFAVISVNLAGHAIETPPQHIYRRYPCPICGSEAHLQPIAEVFARGVTSLESALCTACEHRFQRKFPTVEWLQEYYAQKFESGRSERDAALPPIGRRSVARRLRSRVGTLVRHGISQSKPNRIHDFCLGLTKGDRWYYRPDPSIRKVLEIGCGSGDNLYFFADLGYETYGTESNPIRVAECRRKGLRVFPSAIDNFDAVDGYGPFDFIYSSHVLEHVIDVDRHIAQLAGMLRPEGFLYIETPDQSGESLVPQTHTIFHVHTFSLPSMLRLLAKYGLEPVRVLADGNLQVLAHKRGAERTAKAPLVSGVLYASSSAGYLDAIARHAPGEFRLRWDHHSMDVQRTDDRTTIYSRPLRPLEVARGANTHEMICRVSGPVTERVTYPIRFHYGDASDPPLWYKI
jgi:2-polyprenyl-3-methyl-5-hydroxy-6-metoxy-1,4-benzoquinol methylase